MQQAGERWRLGRRPALDGLRGVAILLVLICHAHVPGMKAAGAVGVTMFFTLSGFLITVLLLQEHATSGRIDLRAFYLRRARRLLPALAAFLPVVVAGGLVLGRDFASLAGGVAVMLYASNWIAATNLYLGGLTHTWSLSVEEQFYLVWPLVLLVAIRRWGRGGLLVVAAVGSVGSVVERFALWDGGHAPWRIYFGTDTRADALLLGCLLAVALSSMREGESRPVLAGAALVATVPLWFTSNYAEWMLIPLVVPALTCVLLFAAARGRDVGWLTWRPLRWLGRRSYGLYLWHYPMMLWLGGTMGGRAAAVLVALAVAELSWRYVEQPFLRRRSGERLDRAAVPPARGGGGLDRSPVPPAFQRG